ncbi:MAG: hypothetical protein F7C09_07440 [Aeropyrum sp.]|nr:hypothetical protein [Aeropyrum sp.]
MVLNIFGRRARIKYSNGAPLELSGYRLLKALLAVSSETLRSVWSDVALEDYRWAIIKSWTAARDAVSLLAIREGVQAPPTSISGMAAAAANTCSSLEWRDVALLDFLHELVTDLGLLTVYFPPGGGPTRVEALDAIESSVKIVGVVGGCIEEGGSQNRWKSIVSPPFGVLRRKAATHSARGVTIVRWRSKVLIIKPELPQRASARIDEIESMELPRGFTLIPLTAEEAYAYANLPWTVFDDIEVVRDDLGLGAVFESKGVGAEASF